MVKKIPKVKEVAVPLDEQYKVVQDAFEVYLASLNIPAIIGAKVVPVLILEVTILDERMAKPVEFLVKAFGDDVDILTMPVIKLQKEEVGTS